MNVMLRLHTDLFAGQAGLYFRGAMGALLVASVVSGAVLYAPFMRKLNFGQIGKSAGARVRWLDFHNLGAAAAFAWTLVVAATSVINTLSTPIRSTWRGRQVAAMHDQYG